jgi:hypothetical protein
MGVRNIVGEMAIFQQLRSEFGMGLWHTHGWDESALLKFIDSKLVTHHERACRQEGPTTVAVEQR